MAGGRAGGGICVKQVSSHTERNHVNQSRKLRILNVAGLASGFALGQGSMFLAQTWLVATNSLSIVGELGLALAVVSLVQWLADWGGTIILSRHAAQNEDSKFFISANFTRLILAVPILFVVSVFLLAVSDAPMLAGVILTGVGTAIFWAWNLTGYLDGKGKSAYSGPVSGLSWLAASLGIFLVDFEHPYSAGLTIGAMFTAGAGLTVFAQYVIAMRTGVHLKLSVPEMQQMRRFAREGGAFCLAGGPAQIYGRSLIAIVNAFLGADMAGVYVYIRQVIVAANQAIMFVRRVEFPTLVQRIQDEQITLFRLLTIQSWSISTSIIFYAVIFFSVMSGRNLLPSTYGIVLDNVLIFGILIPTWCFSSALGLLIVALEKTTTYAQIFLFTLFFCIISIIVFINPHGLIVIVMSEVAMHCLQIALYILFFRHRTTINFITKDVQTPLGE